MRGPWNLEFSAPPYYQGSIDRRAIWLQTATSFNLRRGWQGRVERFCSDLDRFSAWTHTPAGRQETSWNAQPCLVYCGSVDPPSARFVSRLCLSAASGASWSTFPTMRRTLFPILAAVCATFTLSACQTAAPDQPGSAFVAPQGRKGALIHRDSNFSFPPMLAGFQRMRHVQFDAKGQDISVDYAHDDPRVAAAIYVIPRNGQSAEQELDRRVGEVGARHPGARAVASGPINVSPAHEKALFAEFRYEGPFGGQRQPLRSRLIVAEHKEWFVVYRFSYAAEGRASAEPLTMALANEFAWP